MIVTNFPERIKQNAETFRSGNINYLPFPNFGKFTDDFPGLMRGDITCLTGTPASSKSSFLKELLEHSAIPWAINNKKNLHIIKFGLEEPLYQYHYSLLSNRLYKDHKIEYNLRDFEGVGRCVEEKHLPLIAQTDEKVKRMMKYITYKDTTYNSFGFWKDVRNVALNRGKFYKQGKEVTPDKDGWDSYKPNDPDEFVVVVIDNLSYVSKQENEKDVAEAIWNTVENQRKYSANKLNYIVVFVQHQNADSENQESRKDKSILPTENGLAKDNRPSKIP